jgi:hypothetical protein
VRPDQRLRRRLRYVLIDGITFQHLYKLTSMNVHSALDTFWRKSRHFVRVLEGIVAEEANFDRAARVEWALISRIAADVVRLQRESGLETLQDTTSNTGSFVIVNNKGVSIVLDKIISSVNVETLGSCATLRSITINRVPRIVLLLGSKEFLVPIVTS